MAVVGFVAHTHRAGALELVEQTSKWLRAQGHEPRLLDGLGPDDGLAGTRPGDDAAVEGLDLAVSVGGDGTMLRTVDLVSSAGIPVLGVNFGHLGYLTTVEPDGLRTALERFLSGDHDVESRMMLDVAVIDGPVAGPDPKVVLRRTALNDLVLQRPSGGHTIWVELALNHTPFLSFAADSLIVATPTGSTAYNLSARGPIVSPRARVQIVTPVAPHMLFDRSLVLSADDQVTLSPIDFRPADLVVDGWPAATLLPGQHLSCGPAERDALLVTFGDRDFHRILKRKFDLTDR
jgi:NAD+ kinase